MSPVFPDTAPHFSCPPPAVVQWVLNQHQTPEKQPCFWVTRLRPASWNHPTGVEPPARWQTAGRSGTGQAGSSAAEQCVSVGTDAARHRGTSLLHGRLVSRDPAGRRISPAPDPDWERVLQTFLRQINEKSSHKQYSKAIGPFYWPKFSLHYYSRTMFT